MKADERQRLETNALAGGAAALVDRAKAGTLVPPKVLAGVLAVTLLGGVGYYVLRSNQSAASTNWASFADIVRTGGAESLDQYAKANSTDTPGRLARRELARLKLGADGIGKLPVRDAEQRTKAIASIEAAREELVKLADEFRTDATLRAACLLDAAEAELALVGIPKTSVGNDFRGTVAAAAGLVRQAADAVGPTTPAGESLVKRAADLDANKAQVEEVGVRLNSLLTPPPSLVPNNELGSPKAPGGPPIKDPAPPAAPGEGPKAPAGLGTPPTGSGSSPTTR